MEQREKIRNYADGMSRYISIHPDYDNWVKDDAVREVISVMATDIGAAQGFLDLIGVKIDLYTYDFEGDVMSFDGFETHKNLTTGDFRDKKTPFTLKNVVITCKGEFDLEQPLREFLERLNLIPGLIEADSFTMHIDNSNMEKNEYTLTLNFNEGESNAI